MVDENGITRANGVAHRVRMRTCPSPSRAVAARVPIVVVEFLAASKVDKVDELLALEQQDGESHVFTHDDVKPRLQRYKHGHQIPCDRVHGAVGKDEIARPGIVELADDGEIHRSLEPSSLLGHPGEQEAVPEAAGVEPRVRVHFGDKLVTHIIVVQVLVELERLDRVGGEIVLLNPVQDNHVAVGPVLHCHHLSPTRARVRDDEAAIEGNVLVELHPGGANLHAGLGVGSGADDGGKPGAGPFLRRLVGGLERRVGERVQRVELLGEVVDEGAVDDGLGFGRREGSMVPGPPLEEDEEDDEVDEEGEQQSTMVLGRRHKTAQPRRQGQVGERREIPAGLVDAGADGQRNVRDAHATEASETTTTRARSRSRW